MKEKQPRTKKTAEQKRLFAKRILIGSSLAFAISWSTSMVSSTIEHNKIDKLEDEKTKIYEQYMQSDEFKISSTGKLIGLALDYANDVIDYDTFKNDLDNLYTAETADKLLETSTSELKTQLKQIDQQITDINKIHDPIYYVCATILGVSAISGFATGLPLFFADYKKKLENAVDNKEQESLKYYDSTSMTIRTVGENNVANKSRSVNACIIETEEQNNQEENQNTI